MMQAMTLPPRPAGPAERPTSCRALLRTATAGLHERVDARLSGPFDSSRSSYAAFLATLAGAVLPLEAALEAGGIEALMPDWPTRRRGPALRHDLAVLATEVPAARAAGAIDGEARLLGALYVLEGSRLGGRLLLRRVLDNPDPQVRRATRFLAQGEEIGLWRSFLARLESSPAVTAAPPAAIAAARGAFTLFLSEP